MASFTFIGLSEARMGKCNQRQERRKHREDAEMELHSPLRRGLPDAVTSMAAPEFGLNSHPPKARDAIDRELVQHMALCISSLEQRLGTSTRT
jgi:hypothetical protein